MEPDPHNPTQSSRDCLALDVSVLDDDRDFCQYIEDILTDDGHRARFFQEPTELLASLADRRPDVIFLDMHMGVHRGEEVLAKIREIDTEVCVIIITGYPSLEDMRATFRLRVFDYLAKPFSLSEFRDVLHRAAETFDLGRNDLDRLREQLGHRIKVIRIDRKWSLKDLGEKTGISVSQLSSIERGAHLPSMESFLGICHAFSTRPSRLLRDISF